jgi:hypothetical protein
VEGVIRPSTVTNNGPLKELADKHSIYPRGTWMPAVTGGTPASTSRPCG